jgi:hypothetical protein
METKPQMSGANPGGCHESFPDYISSSAFFSSLLNISSGFAS